MGYLSVFQLFALSGYKISRGGVGGFYRWFVIGDVFGVEL